MALTVVGSIAFDSVRTPFGERDRMLGGSAVHFALAARFFTSVQIVGPVGDDFGDDHLELLRERGIDTSDVERVDGGETFFWRGHYEADMNLAHTDDTQLGVFADFDPKLSDTSRAADVRCAIRSPVAGLKSVTGRNNRFGIMGVSPISP